MKKITILLFIALVSAFLFGCQTEKEPTKAEEHKNESKTTKSEKLLLEGEITKVEVSKTKGIEPVIYEEADHLVAFNDVFLSETREPGTVNVTDPHFYLKLTYEDGNIQRLYLWIGNKEEQSMLMNPNNTNTVYTVTTDMTAKLIELIEK